MNEKLFDGSIVAGIGQGISTALGGVTNLVTGVLGAATGVLNSPAGGAGLSVLGAAVGGPAGVALAGLGQGASNVAKTGPGWTEPLTSKLFNFYLLDAKGLYQRTAAGGRRLNWFKTLAAILIPVGLFIWAKKKRWL